MPEVRTDAGDVLLVEQPPLSMILTHLRNKKDSIDENRIFAKEIVGNNPVAVTFFLDEFSTPLLRYVATAILCCERDGDHGEAYQELSGEYYLFIAAPFSENDLPQWRKIDQYESRNHAKLITWVSLITNRYFIFQRKKSIEQNKNRSELSELLDYGTLLRGAYMEEKDCGDMSESLSVLRKAYLCLKERDRVVLQCLVMDKMHWTEAFALLREYLDPLGPQKAWETWSHEQKQRGIDRSWSDKQKQDAMAGLKKRAIEHLVERYAKIKKGQ